MPRLKKSSITLTVKEALQQASLNLKNAGLEKPFWEAELLMALTLKTNRIKIISYPEKRISARQLQSFFKLVKKRKEHTPLAYLSGEKEFYGLKFLVNSNVLVPRPESELLVEEAWQEIKDLRKEQPKHPLYLIDIGTGSGCLAISLCKYAKITTFALDISPKALSVAKKNAKLNKVKNITFIKSDLLKKLPKSLLEKNLIITANLPYLTPKEIAKEPSVKKEPVIALDGGYDGLTIYRRLFKEIKELKEFKKFKKLKETKRVKKFKEKNDQKIVVLCEINPRQKNPLIKISKEEGSKKIEWKKDLAGKIRLVKIEF